MTTLPAGVALLKNFTADGGKYGRLNPTGQSLIGAGRGAGGTVFRLAPHSSTRKKSVPTKKGATTNPLYVVKMQGGRNVFARGFAVEGTEQGHLFNGFRADRIDGLTVDEVRVAGIPGNSDINPGETFLLNLYRCTDVSVSDTELDGSGVGASGLGINSCSGVLLVNRVTGHDLKWCKVIAGWKKPDGGRYTDVQALHVAFGFGLEQCAGLHTIERYKSRDVRRADLHLAANRDSKGTARVHFVDPDLAAGQRLKILVPKTELGKPNTQSTAHVTCTVKGKSRPDLLQFVTKA